ncbi:hypothetical protein Tco_0278557, partial [Tanacetum coccineum]
LLVQVMAALVISISSDVSVESVGSSFPRVILIGSISVEVPVAPEVRAAVVVLPIGVLELDTYSSSKADPSESSPPPISVAPMVLPFYVQTIQSQILRYPREILTTPILPAPSAIVAPSSEYLLALVVAPPKICQRRAILIQPGEDIPIALRTPRCSEAYLRWRSAPLSTMYPPTTSESSPGDSSFESSAGPSRKRCRSPAATVTSSIHATRALVLSYADLLPPRKRFRDSILPEDSVEEDIDMDVLEDFEADATAVEVAVDRDVMTGFDAGIDMEVDVGVDVEDEIEDEAESSDRGTMEVGVDVVAGIDILDFMLIPDDVEHLEQVEGGLQDIYDHVIEIPL